MPRVPRVLLARRGQGEMDSNRHTEGSRGGQGGQGSVSALVAEGLPDPRRVSRLRAVTLRLSAAE